MIPVIPPAPGNNRKSGLYRKYAVVRYDGKGLSGKTHDHCTHFVLDVTCDPFALPAIKAYADACREEYPKLADDLLDLYDVVWNNRQLLF